MDTKQPEALRLANMLEKPGYGWHSTPAECAAELQRLQSENDTLRAGYDAARLEIESLQAQVWQCGAGAGCCAQAARIEELEAQLEAVGADPDDEAVPANAAESYTQRVIEALYENGDPVSADAAEELQRLAAQLEAVGAVPDGWQLVPVEPTKGMKAAAVKFANGNAVYKNVSAGVLEIEEGIYGEAYEAMLAAAPQPPAQALDAGWTQDDLRESCAIGRAPAQPVGALAAKAAVHDAVEAAAIQFISRLTGMAPPPLECAPPEVTAPFKQFADEVMAAIGAAAPQPPAQAQEDARKQDDELILRLLEALEHHREQTRPIFRTDEAITAARARLAATP